MGFARGAGAARKSNNAAKYILAASPLNIKIVPLYNFKRHTFPLAAGHFP
jgi:hypothetical protein